MKAGETICFQYSFLNIIRNNGENPPTYEKATLFSEKKPQTAKMFFRFEVRLVAKWRIKKLK